MSDKIPIWMRFPSDINLKYLDSLSDEEFKKYFGVSYNISNKSVKNKQYEHTNRKKCDNDKKNNDN
jgi:hypothetical protein